MPRRQDAISKITIYKLKVQETDPSALAFDSYDMVSSVTASQENNMTGYALYLYKPVPLEHKPKWSKLFAGMNLDLGNFNNTFPTVKNAGFILIITNQTSSFACTGGLGHHELTGSCQIEPRFGIELAKKLVSSSQISGLVQKDTAGIVNHLDRVFRSTYNPKSDIDNLHRVLTNLRASFPKEDADYSEIGSSIRASDSLTVSGSKNFQDLLVFIQKIEEIMHRNVQTLDIPELDYINPKHDSILLDNLNKQLILSIIQYLPTNNNSPNSLFLDNADVGFLPDMTDSYEVMYEGTHEDFSDYRSVLAKAATILNDVDEAARGSKFKKIFLRLKMEGEDQLTPAKELYHYICGDVTFNGETYFVNNKLWYRANASFIGRITNELNEIKCIPPETLSLIPWSHAEEKFYNLGHSTTHIVLDRHCVRIGQEAGPIEFCDLLLFEDSMANLIHVKKACGAALRALFAQGYVAAELYAAEDEFRRKVHSADVDASDALTQANKDQMARMSSLAKHQITIVYAIYDDTSSHTVTTPTDDRVNTVFSGTLTLFAKIDLLSRVQALRGRGFNVALTRIKPYPTVN